MPNAKVLSEKKQIVEELTEKLKSQAGVFVDYSGITVNEDTQMRVKLREANIDYTVIKNTLMRFAIKNVGFEELDPILNGTTSLAVSKDDSIAPARVIKEYADKFNNYFEIKGGFMDGKVLSVSEVNALASIPPLPVLQAQLLGTMLAPIVSLAIVLKAAAEKNGAPADDSAGDSPSAAGEAVTSDEVKAEAAGETPAEAPAESASEAPVEAAEDAPAETESAAPAEAAEETPAETESAASTETAGETPAEAASETPAEAADEAPAEDN